LIVGKGSEVASVLVSFVGSGKLAPARYRFGDRAIDIRSGRFFTVPLLKHLKERSRKIDRLVLCGTDTSGWRSIVDLIAEPEADPKDGLSNSPIDSRELADICCAVSRQLKLPVQAEIIPYGTSRREQIGFISKIAEMVLQSDQVHFDVTHALRHLPLLTLFAALAIRTIKGAKIGGIWYGAFELRNQDAAGAAPVLNLNGLLSIVDWIISTNIFERTGDVSVFGPLIDDESNLGLSHALRTAAFRQRTAGPDSARSDVLDALEKLTEVDDGVAYLFRPAIEEQFSWVNDPLRANDGHRLARRALAGC
jgi:CRISPR-associated Csx2 family protein